MAWPLFTKAADSRDVSCNNRCCVLLNFMTRLKNMDILKIEEADFDYICLYLDFIAEEMLLQQ